MDRLGGLSRQFDGRRHADHDAHAGKVRSDAGADQRLPDLWLLQTNNTFSTSNTAGTIGSKVGNFSFFLSANREESFSQPLGFVTNPTSVAGTQGTLFALNKTGGVADVVGASGLLHTTMNNYKLKWAVDLNDWLKFSHTLGYWQNIGYSTVQSYLTAPDGSMTFGGVSGFASGNYNIQEQHLANAVR